MNVKRMIPLIAVFAVIAVITSASAVSDAETADDNIFDPAVQDVNGYIRLTGQLGGINSTQTTNVMAQIVIEPNTTYHISCDASNRFRVGTLNSTDLETDFFLESFYVSPLDDNGTSFVGEASCDITSGSDHDLMLLFYYTSTSTMDQSTIRDSISVTEVRAETCTKAPTAGYDVMDIPAVSDDEGYSAYNSSVSYRYEIGQEFSESFAMPYRSSGSTNQRSTTNVPDWVTMQGSNGYSLISGTAPSVPGTFQFSAYYSYSGSVSTEYCTVNYTVAVYIPSYTVTFNGNGGTATNPTVTAANGSSSYDAIYLSGIVTRSGYDFDGWYTEASGGTRVGGASSTYTPMENMTLYAHWSETVYSVGISSTCYSQVDSGGVFSYTPTTTPSNASISIVNDPTGCLGMSGRTVIGTLTDILPGTYYATIRASATGYSSATQTITIVVPVFVYEPLTDTVDLDQPWTYTLTANPSSAKIASYTIKDASGSVPSGNDYSLSMATKSVTVSFSAAGTYTIVLTISATGYTSTTKTITLNAFDMAADTSSPSVSQMVIVEHPTVDGGYYFTALQPAHYTSITWDFGDGTSNASGTNVTHKYTSNGSKTVTLTLYNKDAAGTKYATLTESVEVELTLRSTIDAWVGVEYSLSLPVADADATYILEARGDGNTEYTWLILSDFFTSEGHRYLSVNGIPDASVANTTADCNIYLVEYESDGTTVKTKTAISTWTVNVWPSVEESRISVDMTITINNHIVTLTNRGISGTGVIMFVDWGDGSGSHRQTSTITAMHTYDEDGYYNITMELVVNGEEYKTTGYAQVPSVTIIYTVTFNANGGSGSISPMSGQIVTVPECTFTNDTEFESWNTSANGTGTMFVPGQMLTPDSNLTLYAQWAEDNGGDGDAGGDHTDYTIPIVILILAIIVIAVIITRVI